MLIVHIFFVQNKVKEMHFQLANYIAKNFRQIGWWSRKGPDQVAAFSDLVMDDVISRSMSIDLGMSVIHVKCPHDACTIDHVVKAKESVHTI